MSEVPDNYLYTREHEWLKLEDDGSLTVYTGSTSNGQGHETVWAQVAGQRFDIPPDRIQVVGGDTSRVADGWGSMASRSAQIGASGVWRTSGVVFERAKQVAAVELEVSPHDLVVRDGRFEVVGVPDSGVDLAAIKAAAEATGVALSAEEMYSPGAQTFPNGVHAAVVEVEPETGEVRVLRYVAVDDCGTVLNPMVVEGQNHGSIAQGLGQAMYEAIVYSDDGQLLTSTMMDYSIPHARTCRRFGLAASSRPLHRTPLVPKDRVRPVVSAPHPPSSTPCSMPYAPTA